MSFTHNKLFYKKKQWRPPSKKEERRKKSKPEEQEGMPQHQHCPPKRNAEIRAQSAMKSSRKTLHEFTSHIPPKTPKRNGSSSTNEMLQTDITI
jgi:hypothetical protein